MTSLDCTSPWNSPCQNTGVDNLSLLQEIFPTHRLNPGLLHCRQILYQLSHKGSPRITEWVAYPFSSGSSRLRNRIVSPTLQIDSLPTEPLGKLPPKRSFSVLLQRTENKILLQNRKVSILFICPENSATSSGTCFFVFLRKPKASSPMLAHGVLKWLVLPLIQKSSKTQN